MNPFQFTATCDVCGGPGAADSRTAAAAWDSHSFISHVDPRECAAYLAKLKRQEVAQEVKP